MRTLNLCIPKAGTDNKQIGINENFRVGKRKEGISYHLVAGLTANMQPLNVCIRKQGVFALVDALKYKNKRMPSYYYILSQVVYILDIQYTVYENGKENFKYTVLVPKNCDIDKKQLYCTKVLGFELKENLINYYKELCKSRITLREDKK